MGQAWRPPAGAWIKAPASERFSFKTSLRRLCFVSDEELLHNAPYDFLYITDTASTIEQYHIVAKKQGIPWSEGDYNNAFVLDTVQGRLEVLCRAKVLQGWRKTLQERCAWIEEASRVRGRKRRRLSASVSGHKTVVFKKKTHAQNRGMLLHVWRGGASWGCTFYKPWKNRWCHEAVCHDCVEKVTAKEYAYPGILEDHSGWWWRKMKRDEAGYHEYEDSLTLCNFIAFSPIITPTKHLEVCLE